MRTILLALLIFLVSNTFAQNVAVKFEIINLKSSEGSIIVSIYKDKKSFDEGNPSSYKVIPKKGKSIGGIFRAQFLLPPGVYGLVFVDDENNDGKMTNRKIGIPKEGFGFSNFYLSGFKKPKFSDFSFTLGENSKTMKIRLRYM